MENMDNGLIVPKWVLINHLKTPQIPQNLSAQIVCLSPKVWDFNEKRLHWASVVRGFFNVSYTVLGMYKSLGGLIQSWFLPWSSWVLYWPRKKQAQSSAYFYGAFTLGHHTNTQWIQSYFGAAFEFLNNTLS